MTPEIERDFAEVIEAHGKELFWLVWNAEMAGEAVAVLVNLMRKHRSSGGINAVGTVATAFNEVAELLRQHGAYTKEQLVECDAAIKAAFAKRIVVPESGVILH